jgi:hypothetical protein
MLFEKQRPVNDKTKQVNTYCQTLGINPVCSAIIRPLWGDCRYAIICMVEKAAAPAKGKGIFCQTITKSGLKFCK